MMLQKLRPWFYIPALLIPSLITTGSAKEVYVGPGTQYTSISAALSQFYPLTEDLEVRVIVPSGIYSEPEDISPTVSQLDGHSIYIEATTDVPSATYYVEDEAVFQGIVNVSLVYENITGINGKEGRIASGSPKFLIKDHLGSTRETIDETGASVDRTAYYSYGRMNKMVTSQAASKEKFTTKEFDEDEGIDLYYFGARYLDPELGMWISPDPTQQFASPYSYTGNGWNPISGVDPDGKDVIVFSRALPVGGWPVPFGRHLFVGVTDPSSGDLVTYSLIGNVAGGKAGEIQRNNPNDVAAWKNASAFASYKVSEGDPAFDKMTLNALNSFKPEDTYPKSGWGRNSNTFMNDFFLDFAGIKLPTFPGAVFQKDDANVHIDVDITSHTTVPCSPCQ